MKNYIKKTVILIISLAVIFVAVFGNIKNEWGEIYAAETAVVKPGTEMLRVRATPGGTIMNDKYGDTIYLYGGHRLTVLDKSNSAWYKVTFSYNGEQITGYVSTDWITVTDNSDNSNQNTSESGMSENEFEDYLDAQGFPDSYKPYLRDLHRLHPSWIFKAYNTGLDFNTFYENERNKQGQIKNLVQGTSYEPHYNWRSTEVGYNAKTNTWYSYDGDCWYAASNELVKYYLDPRTYLWENFIFVFESLSYQNGQNQTAVESILKGTFMANAYPRGENKKYSQLIMEAAQSTGVSPYHIASRIRQEMGTTAGVCATGTSSSFPGIFNFYNIGAFDSAAGDAVHNGLKWAATSGSYGRPWNTAAKSIYGGAQFIGEDYINVGQDTLYCQKFNVSSYMTYYHQYMTNIQAPRSEALSQYSAYASNGLLDSAIVFKIPVFYNMPDYTEKPSDSGNPNNFLSNLGVSGYSLTPTFGYTTSNYSLIVPNNVTQLTITASPVASTSHIQGTGKVNVNVGENKYMVKCISQSGVSRVYWIKVIRKEADSSSGNSGGSGSSSGSGSSGNSGNSGGSGSSGNSGNSGSQETVKVHRGDLTGDGKITALDIVKIQRIIIGRDKLTDENKALADVNGDGKVSALDIVKIQRHIIGREKISW